MQEVIDRLVRYLVFQAKVFEERAETLLDPRNPEGIHAFPRQGHIAYHYLALYLTRHPENPYHRDPKAMEMCQRIIRVWLAEWTEQIRTGGSIDSEEWRPYIVLRCIEKLGRRMDPALRREAERAIRLFVAAELPQPFFFTAPNHEAWKLMVAAVAGRVLRKPEWRKQAGFEILQLLKYQTPEGFWEEGRHHGPSMAYNFVMLTPLAVLCRELGDEKLLAATRRLVKFMVSWTFPDGIRAGALDGRTAMGEGTPIPGLERVPEGVTLLTRLLKTADEAGWLDPMRRDTPMYGAASDASFMSTEALLYYSGMRRFPAARPLVFDARNATRENHTAYLNATMARRGAWTLALSSQISDVPKDTQFIYRLERQNRIDVWHEKASVVIGGGHNLVTSPHPLYNAWVEPGYHLDPSEYSKTSDDAGSPAMARRRSKYYPRWADSGATGSGAWLELTFAHATVRFELEPRGDRLEIRYRYACTRIEELRLCLPLVLWHPGRLRVDGRRLASDKNGIERPVKRGVVAEDLFHGTRTVLRPPAAGKTFLRFPGDVARAYVRRPGQDTMIWPFSIGQMETVIRNPPRRGVGRWMLEVEES